MEGEHGFILPPSLDLLLHKFVDPSQRSFRSSSAVTLVVVKVTKRTP